MAAFSTTDEAVLTAPLELNPLAQSATASSSGRSIYYVYDILSTAAKIHNGRFQRVALQFPDEALVDSVPVYWALKKEVRELYSANSTASESASPSASTSASSKASSGLPEFYILADTSYGGCCVDEVAAKHVDADLVVHYGHACLSATARLPVIYVFTKQPLADVAAAAKALAQKAKEHICNGDAEDIRALVLTYDVSWDHVVDDLFQATKLALAEQGIELPLVRTHVDVRRNYDDKLVNGKSTASDQVAPAGCCGGQSGACGAGGSTSTSSCCGGGACSSSNPRSSCAKATSTASSAPAATPTSIDPASERAANPLGSCRRVTLPPSTTFSQCGYLYLGPESLSLTNLLLTLGASTPLISFDPLSSTARVETGSTNRLLMKRYASVLKARDASVVGLLVGTLGVHSYLPLLRYLRSLLTGKRSGRKVYTISVGKLNPAKLANFQEIDVFVLVACPENTLVDSKEFFRPIVTPFEMELAVRAAERQQRGEEGVDWSGKYVLDLEKLVPAEYSREDADGDLLAKTETQLSLNPAQDADEEENDDGEEEDDRPHFSLISGTYVHRRKFNHRRTNPAQLDPAQPGEQTLELSQSTSGAGTGTNGDKVVVRNATTGELTTVLESASMAHLSQRSWKGLEQRLGLDEPSVLEEGREGIAKGYKDAGGQGHIM